MTYKPGDKVEVITSDGSMTGMIMPNDSKDILFIKLSNGYNVGIDVKKIKSVKVTEAFKEVKKETSHELKVDKKLPTISILHTGGTIASQVDYRTGAVVSRFTPEDLLKLVPELKDIANIETETVFQMFSEDMEVSHWSLLAEAIDKELKKKPKGIIIGIGTDTLEYVSAALSFALQNVQIPVVVVGSQRSSDRPSSDAGINLMCASQFIAKTDLRGVFVCMHANENDDYCYVMEGLHVKKMHTSRRDTFRPINIKPILHISPKGEIEQIRNYKNTDGTYKLQSKFSDKIGLVKIYPGFRKEELDYYEKNCDGLVIEGYAFGQMPINKLDKATEHHPELLKKLESIAKKMPVAVVSQRPYGETFMHVYSTSRDMLNVGVIEAKTLPHVAYAKLSWILGHAKGEEAKKLLKSNIAGEILNRIDHDTFLI